MKPFPKPNVSANPFKLSVERLMDSSPSMIFNAWTKQPFVLEHLDRRMKELV